MRWIIIDRGGSRIFFRRECTRLLLYFNTNKPNSFFFCKIPVVLENRRSCQGGGMHTPCTLPLDPPLIDLSSSSSSMHLHVRRSDLTSLNPLHFKTGFMGLGVKELHHILLLDFFYFSNLKITFTGLVYNVPSKYCCLNGLVPRSF